MCLRLYDDVNPAQLIVSQQVWIDVHEPETSPQGKKMSKTKAWGYFA